MSGDNLRKAGAILNRINDSLAILAGILVIYMMLSVSYEVVMRYFLNRPTSWVVDIASLAILYFTFLGAAWLLRKDGHVYMDMLLIRLRPRIQSLINIITSILGAFVCFALAWYGTKLTWEHFQEGIYTWGVLSLPSPLSLFIIPAGFFLLFIQFLIRAYSSRTM